MPPGFCESTRVYSSCFMRAKTTLSCFTLSYAPVAFFVSRKIPKGPQLKIQNACRKVGPLPGEREDKLADGDRDGSKGDKLCGQCHIQPIQARRFGPSFFALCLYSLVAVVFKDSQACLCFVSANVVWVRLWEFPSRRRRLRRMSHLLGVFLSQSLKMAE